MLAVCRCSNADQLGPVPQIEIKSPDLMSHVFYRQPEQDYPVAVRGEGIEIIDRDGKRYLDASGGAAVSCLGHSHPRVIEAIQAQVGRLAYRAQQLLHERAGGSARRSPDRSARPPGSTRYSSSAAAPRRSRRR